MNAPPLYAGVDLHKRFSYITVMDREGHIKQHGKVDNDNQTLKDYFAQFTSPLEIVVESTFNSWWFYDLIHDPTKQVVVGNSKKIKAIGSGVAKTDKIDSKMLADLLRSNMLPKITIPTDEQKEWKELVRMRYYLTRMRTSVKNKIHSYLLRFNIRHEFEDLFSKKGKAWLKTVCLRGIYQQHLKDLLSLEAELEKRRKVYTEQIKTQVEQKPAAQLLCTIPGIDTYTALLLLAEIGEIKRFPSAKELCAYAGLVPKVRQSADKKYTSKISRQGSKYIRWVMGEAVQRLAQHQSQLGAQYRRIMKRRNKYIARVALSRKLLGVVYHVLTTGEIYQSYPLNAGHSS